MRYFKLKKLSKYITTIVFLLAFYTSTSAQNLQRYNCYSFNVNEGLLQSTISDIAFDKDNFCWIGFPNGLQKFDGVNFLNIPIQPGLPDDKFINFIKTDNGDLLLSHNQGVSRYLINSNKFEQVYFKTNATPSQFMGEDGNIIYLCSETGNLTAINSRSFKKMWEKNIGINTISTGNGPIIKFSDNIINHQIGILANYKLYLLDLGKQQIVDSSAYMPKISTYLLQLKNTNELFYFNYTQKHPLQYYNFSNKKSVPLPIKRKDESKIYRCNIYKWQSKQLLSFNNTLFETDSTLEVVKNELVNLQNEPVAENIGIVKIKADNYGNLWLQTIRGGLKKISQQKYPLEYYGTPKKEDNNIMCLLPDKINNRVLAGTVGNGLLVFDTLQHLIKHIRNLPGQTLSFSVNIIIKKENGDYLLYVTGEKKIWQLTKNLALFSSINIATSLSPEQSGIQYFGNFLFQNKNFILTQAQGRLYKVNPKEGKATEYEFTKGYTMSGLLYQNKILTHTADELIYLDTATCTVIKKIPFANTGYVRCFAKDNTGNIYIGSNKGLFKIDGLGKILLRLDKTNELPDECIYAIAIDKQGVLWCSSNKGIFKINKDNRILQLTKEDGLQENEFNTNAVAMATDGELFFGGINGISSFYPAAVKNQPQKVNIFFTSITFNNQQLYKDTAVSTISNIELPYYKNSLSFNFIAMGADNPNQYVYQYKMEGIDKDWIKSNKAQAVHYLLQPGKYVLKVYAATTFDMNAKPLKEISIIIYPPFWKTWWFALLAIIFCIGIIAWLINWHNKNKYQKKLTELEGERKLQLERERISRDLHDNIGAYANAVIYNTELLEKEESTTERNELMQDIRFASKDIITSLRETIWALKKENYSAQDCLLRIRNFIYPFNRYFNHIHFIIEGEAPAHVSMHYTQALNLVRIVQEAVSNAIKHSNAQSITVSSSTQNNQWLITVVDDGNGFDYNANRKAKEGNGLNNMQQRATDAGFIFLIAPATTRGTVVSILM